jgi:hypothetical protein
MEESHKAKLCTGYHAAVGAVVGSIEQTMMKPIQFAKYRLQQQNFELAQVLNPRYSYRGLTTSLVSIAPITCIQFSCNSSLLRFLGGSSPSNKDKLSAGAIAGMSSAMVQSPFQLIEVTQQNHGGTMTSTVRRIFAGGGLSALYTGFFMTAVREAGFCTSYIAIAPILKDKILQHNPQYSYHVANAASSMFAGGIGSLFTHPADTMKTRLQAGLLPRGSQDLLVRNTICSIFSEMRLHGHVVSQCFAGFAPRLLRLICCSFIYNSLTPLFEAVALAHLDGSPSLQIEIPGNPVPEVGVLKFVMISET